MDLQLKGKTALVTGSTAGIGLAIAAALAKEGAEVIVNGRTQKRVDRAIKSTGAGQGIAADLGTKAGTTESPKPRISRFREHPPKALRELRLL